MIGGAKVVGLDKLTHRLERFGTEAQGVNRRIVQAVALEAKRIAVGEAARDVGSDLRMSGFARGRGVKLSATFDVKGTRKPTAIVRGVPPGPWALLEHGSSGPYMIGSRAASRGRGRGRSTARGFFGNEARGFAAMSPVQHPAQRAKHTWSRSSAKAIAAGRVMFTTAGRQEYMRLLAGG